MIILFVIILKFLLKYNEKNKQKINHKNKSQKDFIQETGSLKTGTSDQVNNLKKDLGKISKEWNSILSLIENNIQEIYKKREQLNTRKENLLRKTKNTQEIMNELLIKYNKNSASILKSEYIKHSIELEKFQNEIQVIDKQIIEYNDALQILVEKNNNVQLEYDNFKQSYSHEISKTEIFSKISLINSEIERLKTGEQQSFLTSFAIYKSENVLENNAKFDDNLLKTGKEKKHIDKMNDNLAFENLFFESETEDKKTSPKTVEHLFK
ncbi:hypothetical protein QEJ31_09530 [Pigmentibacter sp. JX0631]|uniref:hypothetical protein n=1 Tax=Pigmentibacter sp. JX0631 TaxID=2976982 RepID=UPI002469AFE8|nr:hypothetical protein [Pigmentibacter sp. JX0631]WGL58765.1 hypothetical protein QEJ31_09530 [Pigmentibacter sp. JX0631]